MYNKRFYLIKNYSNYVIFDVIYCVKFIKTIFEKKIKFVYYLTKNYREK